MTIDEILSEMETARQAVRRAEREYSVCLLTDSLCRDEQKHLERARKRLHELERKLARARRRME